MPWQTIGRALRTHTISSPEFPLPQALDWRYFRSFWDWKQIRVGLEALNTVTHHPLFCGPILVGTATLLISSLPVWSFKNFKVPAEYVLPLLLGTGLFVALLFADPWAALAAGGLIYLMMLPFSVRSFRRLRREAEALRVDEETPAKAY